MTNLMVFDLDGTLIDTMHDLLATMNHVLAQEGCRPVPADEFRCNDRRRRAAHVGARSGRPMTAPRNRTFWIDYSPGSSITTKPISPWKAGPFPAC